MSLDRLHRNPATDVHRTPLVPIVAPSSAQTDMPPQQQSASAVLPALIHNDHYFGNVAVVAPEPQSATEHIAITTEQANEIVARQGAGAPVAPNVREPMESALGHNFGDVRIHIDAEAAALSRSLDARAFTLGRDIFFSQEAANNGVQNDTSLLAHELTHVVQQGGTSVSQLAPGEGLVLSDPHDTSEQEADRVAEAVSEGGVQAGRLPTATTQSSTVARSIQRASANTTAHLQAPGSPLTISRNDVELLGVRFQERLIDLEYFLEAAMTDISNIRNYFKWVNDVYNRCYGHYTLLMQQAKQQVEAQDKWVDLVADVGVGLAVGALAEVVIPLEEAQKVYIVLRDIGSETGAGLIGMATKTDSDAFNIPLDLNPAFKKLAAFQQLDKINTLVLGMAVPGASLYTDPIRDAEHISAELRVAEAGGQRRWSDEEIQEMYLGLLRFEVTSLQLAEHLHEVEGKFDALRKAYMGKKAPTDQRCEQDIWIPWIAEQNPTGRGFWSSGSVLNEKIFLNHFMDIGLVDRLGVYTEDTGAADGTLESDEEPELTASLLIDASKAELQGLHAYWNDVFLMGTGAAAGGDKDE